MPSRWHGLGDWACDERGLVTTMRHRCEVLSVLCACVQPVVHTGMGSLPTRLLLLLACMLRLSHSVRTGGGVGSLVQRSSSTPGNDPTSACSWIPAGMGGIISFTFISFHAVSFLVSGSAGQDPYPSVLISLFCRYTIPSVWHTFGIKMFIHLFMQV